MSDPSPFSPCPGGVRIVLKLTPKGASNKIGTVAFDETGAAFLRASVTAVPEGGKANRALIKLLSKEWKLPKSSISVTSGATDRRKVISVEGGTDDLLAKLTAWMEQQP